ncbi:MAG: hypothetical protein ACKOPQ_01075 [Novosphingobium sp.]
MNPVAMALALCALGLTAACGTSGEAGKASAAADAEGKAQAGEAVTCSDLPPHVALLAGARISLCTRAETSPGHVSGTIVMTSGEAPDAVIAFYKTNAKAAGIPDSIANADPQPGMGPMYSARDGSKRSFMVLTRPAEGGMTEVTVNWGMDR